MRLGGDGNRISSTERTLSSVRDQLTYQYTISDLTQSIKGNFSRKIHIGNLWQRRFYARIVDNQTYFETVIHYIQHNSIRAELTEKYRKVPYQYFNWELINNLFNTTAI